MNGVPEPGLRLIKTFEGCHLSAYPDPLSGGVPYTIGWGSTRRKDGTPFQLGDTLTQAEADDLLRWQVERSFLPALTRIPGWADWTATQAGAILSFAYNLGADFYGASGFETISRTLRAGQWANIEYALTLYRNPRTHVEEGLLRRRLTEAQVFLSELPGYTLSAAGTAYLGTGDRTYRQDPRLSDQSLQYLAALKGAPSSAPAASTEPSSQSADSAPTPSGPRPLYLTEPNLMGEDVLSIQQGLAQAGIAIGVDGVFGPATQRAVERYQHQQGLTVDGVVGELTRSRLLQRSLYLSDPYLTGDDVKAVQQALIHQGLSVAPDGVFGPNTEKAVQTFQRQVGTFVDGVVGPRTRQLLAARQLYLTYPNLTGADVEAAQKALTRAGVTVTVDGRFGPSMEWAVKQFQSRHQLLADGVIGPQTLVKLGAL
ncbi:MAG: hypothetical protein HC812_05855 [Leptolyngbya sp. RL_3_1]|nr:hypothetical protein [Leptolyngbya sp. RL_3_1]